MFGKALSFRRLVKSVALCRPVLTLIDTWVSTDFNFFFFLFLSELKIYFRYSTIELPQHY